MTMQPFPACAGVLGTLFVALQIAYAVSMQSGPIQGKKRVHRHSCHPVLRVLAHLLEVSLHLTLLMRSARRARHDRAQRRVLCGSGSPNRQFGARIAVCGPIVGRPHPALPRPPSSQRPRAGRLAHRAHHGAHAAAAASHAPQPVLWRRWDTSGRLATVFAR